MKTAIITFHFVNNFGGVLQAYSLQRALEKCRGPESGTTETEIIDYRAGFIVFTDFVRLFPLSIDPGEIVCGIRTMKDRFGRIGKFRQFRQEHMRLTPKRYSHWLLKADPPEADCYLCGSDQIWNPYLTLGIEGAYFLDFVPEGKKRIAYAPSFGNSRLPAVYKNRVSKYLESFDAVSVREKSGREIIKGMGIPPSPDRTGRQSWKRPLKERHLTGNCSEKFRLKECRLKEAAQLIDPTFLLSKEEWEELASEKNERWTKRPYMLLYIMQSDRAVYDCAKSLKERLGLRIVEIGRYGYNPGFVDETLVDVGPLEFLGLFRDADYICTNSYHGFIFSLIFEKRFCLVPCKRFTARIYDLADRFSIRLRRRDTSAALDVEYDPAAVKRRISEETEKSAAWLRQQIS